MTERSDWARRALVAVGLLVVVGYLVVNQYATRNAIVQSNRMGCRRGMSDRFSSMESWYAAYLARLSQAKVSTGAQKRTYLASAAVYRAGVVDDMRRVNAHYSLVWPDPRVVHRGPYKHPLGVGHFSCQRAIPSPSLLPSLGQLGL